MVNEKIMKNYDVIFIGTSIICVLEAVYQNLCGKSVLMIDRQDKMGGAWASLNLFGLHDVENAIHYFLPDPYAFEFMRNVLKFNIIHSPKKYRLLPLLFGKCLKLRFDSKLGRCLAGIQECIQYSKKEDIPKKVLRLFKDVFLKPRSPSYYVDGGTPEMLKKVRTILASSSVKIKHSTFIEHIHIDTNTQTVEVFIGKKKLVSKNIYFTNSSRIPRLTSPLGVFYVNEKKCLRPTLHLLVSDDSPSFMYECVLTCDPFIKYVHDITHFTKESVQLKGKKKVLVLALQHHIKKSKKLYKLLMHNLKKIGMIGKNAKREAQYWQDIYLPCLNDSDLERLKSEFGSQVEILKTENFTKSIGCHAKRWAEKIRFPET